MPRSHSLGRDAVRIVIVDDHELIRIATRLILESQPGWQVVGEGVDGREAILLAAQLKPDVLIIDIGMPNLNGFDAIRNIRQNHPEIAILVVSVYQEEQVIRKALAAGSSGYVIKSGRAGELLAGVRSLLEGGQYFSTAIADRVLHFYQQSETSGSAIPEDPPSPREREVLQLLSEGKTNKEVADILHISVRTVDGHRNHLMKKLGARSFSDLIRYAIRNRYTQ